MLWDRDLSDEGADVLLQANTKSYIETSVSPRAKLLALIPSPMINPLYTP